MNLLETLYHLPKSAVIAIEDVKSKSVWLTYSHDTSAAIARIKRYIRSYKLEDRMGDLELRMYDSINDRTYLLLHLGFIEQRYINIGYKLLSKKKGLYYSVEKNIGYEDRLHVNLVNRKKQKICIGVFSNEDDADLFIEQYFGDVVKFPICYISRATKTYLSKLDSGGILNYFS